MVAQIAVPAMQLKAAVHRLEADIGGETLCLRGKPRRAGRLVRYRARRVMHHKARGLQFGCLVSDTECERLKISEPSTELLALAHVLDGTVEAELRATDRARRDVEPPAVEPGHRDLEPLPLHADQV